MGTPFAGPSCRRPVPRLLKELYRHTHGARGSRSRRAAEPSLAVPARRTCVLREYPPTRERGYGRATPLSLTRVFVCAIVYTLVLK